MTTDAPQPDTPDDVGVTQAADPFDPEAPAHVDDEAVVEGADPTPPQPS